MYISIQNQTIYGSHALILVRVGRAVCPYLPSPLPFLLYSSLYPCHSSVTQQPSPPPKPPIPTALDTLAFSIQTCL